MDISQDILFFLIVWIVIFLTDYFFILRPKLKKVMNKKTTKKGKQVDIMEVTYLSGKFKLDKTKLLHKSILLWIAFLNAFIISFTTTVITALPIKMIFQIMVGFVLLFALIYAIYEIFGRMLKRRLDK